MDKTNKLFAILTVLVLVLSMLALSTFADTTIPGTDTIMVDKYLTMDANANVPNAQFRYTIASGEAVEAVITGVDKTPAVMAGPEGALLKYGDQNAAAVDVDFTAIDATYAEKQDGDTIVLAEGEKYAKKEFAVDLTGVTFTEPGIYRFAITETATNDGVTNDTVATRYLDVFIDSDNDGNLSIQGSILHNTTDVAAAANGTYGTDKDGGFTNEYTTYNLTFSKDITGNQGFRSKYFTFTVAITGADAGTVYSVNLDDASPDDGKGNINPTSLTADDSGAVTGTFYLKDDQSITIYGLTSATMYTVSENAEDYTPSYILDGADPVDGNSTPEAAEMDGSDHTADFTNYRNGVVPTGILLEIAPYALVILIAVAAAVLLLMKKRRNTEDK